MHCLREIQPGIDAPEIILILLGKFDPSLKLCNNANKYIAKRQASLAQSGRVDPEGARPDGPETGRGIFESKTWRWHNLCIIYRYGCRTLRSAATAEGGLDKIGQK